MYGDEGVKIQQKAKRSKQMIEDSGTTVEDGKYRTWMTKRKEMKREY